eukprot:symbB.v1.2.011996.t1/scaffold815.1/size160196/7
MKDRINLAITAGVLMVPSLSSYRLLQIGKWRMMAYPNVTKKRRSARAARSRRTDGAEEKRLDRRCAQNAARAEAERRRTALEMLEGERAVARFLKQHGFEGVNCPKKNMLGRYQYPLHKASELGNARLIRMLLREGAIPQNLDSSGRTPLVVAERRNRNGSHMKVIQSLTCPSAAASPNDRYLL